LKTNSAFITLVFSVTDPFRSHSNMLIRCSRNIIIAKCQYFLGNYDTFFQDSLMKMRY